MDKKSVKYNKLVRDKIPEIIEEAGKVPVTRILLGIEFENELTNKLQEELNEYKDNHDIEELADLQEVIDSILHHKDISKDEFYKIVDKKRDQRGSFRDKVCLISVE